MKLSKVEPRNEQETKSSGTSPEVHHQDTSLGSSPCSLRYCVLPEDMLKDKQVEKDSFKPKVSNTQNFVKWTPKQWMEDSGDLVISLLHSSLDLL